MNIKTICVLVFLAVVKRQKYHVEAALTCRGCELTSNQTCNFAYECDDHVDYCETLISKVDGSYSLIFGCGIDKCKGYGKNSTDAGLDKCDFNDPNTECWSCCGSDKCNILKNAFAVLPKDAFSSSSSKGKSSDYDLEDLDEKKFLRQIEEEIAHDEEEIRIGEKKRKFRTISFITTMAGNFSSGSMNVNVSNGSGEMTSTMRTSFSDLSTMSTSDSRTSNGPQTSSSRTTEGSQNSTNEGKLSTAGVESSNDISMLQFTDRNIYTRTPNDSHSRRTTHESITNVTHQPFKSSASSSSIIIPLLLTTFITFFLIN
ncbi:unnamed protein product [Diamesa tonsa]